MVKELLDEYGVDKNALVLPGICLDCDPPRLVDACNDEHGIGAETPLMAACFSGELSVVKLLCDRGVDVNARNEVRCCIAAGVALRGRDVACGPSASQSGRSALLCAASCGYADIVSLLLDRGADVAIRNKVRARACCSTATLFV
jgi:hypothetical protein